MAGYHHNGTLMEGISCWQHEVFQISLRLLVKLSEPVAKIYFSSNLESWNN